MTYFQECFLISSIQKRVLNLFVFLNLCELTETRDLQGEDVPVPGMGRVGGRTESRQVRQHCLCLPEQMKTIQCLVFNFNKFNIQNYMLKIKI